MDLSIVGILLLDGITNGAVYALLGLATVLVFTVTRVIFIPQGEFVAYGALTLAIFQTGKVPGTVWLLLLMAVLAAPQVWKAITYRKDSPEAQTYYAVSTRIKIEYGAYYLILLVFLAMMTQNVHEMPQSVRTVRGT